MPVGDQIGALMIWEMDELAKQRALHSHYLVYVLHTYKRVVYYIDSLSVCNEDQYYSNATL